MPVTETIDAYGRRVQGSSCDCHPPSMGHHFDEHLRCIACEIALEDHQREPMACRGAA